MRLPFTIILCTVLFSLCLTSSLQAQEDETNAPKFSAGVSIGGIVSSVSSNELAFPLSGLDFNTLSIQKKWNESFAIHFLFHINESYGIESGILYDKKSIHLQGNNSGPNEDKETKPKFRYEYITLPLLFKKTIGEQNIKASFHAGPYFSFLQSSTFSDRTYTLIRDNNNNLVEVAEETAYSLKPAANSVNIGVMLKVGAEMQVSEYITPFAQAIYTRSFSKADDFTDIRVDFPDALESDSKFSSFGISVGAYFRMK